MHWSKCLDSNFNIVTSDDYILIFVVLFVIITTIITTIVLFSLKVQAEVSYSLKLENP